MFNLGAAESNVRDDEWTVVTADGRWSAHFEHTVAVPGLVHNASPPFADVDAYDSYELNSNRIRSGQLPPEARAEAPGVSCLKTSRFRCKTWSERSTARMRCLTP